MIKVSSTNFEQVIKENEVVVMDFGAEWCGACNALLPILKNVEKNYPSVCFASVDVDEEEELATLFKIRSIPFVAIFKNGNIIETFLGVHDEDYISRILEK